jgi:hypothetical protein
MQVHSRLTMLLASVASVVITGCGGGVHVVPPYAGTTSPSSAGLESSSALAPTTKQPNAPSGSSTHSISKPLAYSGSWHAAPGCWAIRSRDSLKYVSTEIGYGGTDKGMLRARAGAIGPWEKYQIWERDWADFWETSEFAIMSQANGRFVSTEIGYSGGGAAMLRARNLRVAGIGPWEKYILPGGSGIGPWDRRNPVSNTFFTAEANGLAVAAEDGSNYWGYMQGILRARTSTAWLGGWERFDFIPSSC